MNQRLLSALGAVLWLLGLALFILGLNLPAPAGSWLAVTGNLLFFPGLALEGVVWFRRRREQEKQENGPEGEK